MVRNYLTVALRSMRRRLGFSLVNVGGLAVGLAGCILVFFFIRDEMSFDRFNTHIDRIYEVKSKAKTGSGADLFLETQGPVGPALAADFPEVEAATRIAKSEIIVRVGAGAFLRRGLGVDPSFFKVFSFPLSRGDAASALNSPDSVVLSPETARRCFGSDDAMGQALTLVVEGQVGTFQVAGISREIPANSSLGFDILLPIARVKGPGIDQWAEDGPDAACFIRLKDGADSKALAAKFPAGLDKHLRRGTSTVDHYLFPFAAYHRGIGDYSFSSVLAPRSSPTSSYLLTAIALLILAIAGFNFVNLSIATAASERTKEIGIRKVLGAERKNLFRQFRFEGLLASLIALGLGLTAASLVLPAFNRFSGKAIRLDLLGPGLPLLAMVLFAVVLGSAAGGYPAWYLSRLRPVDLFQGRALGGRRSGFSRVLLVAQFAISVFLVITTGFLTRQHRYLLRTDVGYVSDQVIVLDLSPLARGGQEASRILPLLKSRLLRYPEVKSVGGAGSGMGSWSAWMLRPIGAAQPEAVRFNEIDADFQATLGLRLRAGRGFTADRPEIDRNALIVNETFVRRFTPAQPVGRTLAELFQTKSTARIIGVVRDFHFDSLKSPVGPAMMSLGGDTLEKAFIRLSGRDIAAALKMIEREFRALAPGFPFLFSFLDAEVARQYEDEARWGLMVSIVSLFAILLACSGVFSLAVQSAVRKTKEIGIRRVLGASVPRLVWMLDREFVRLAAAACLIAWPTAYLAVRKILAGYPYRIAVSPWLFLGGGVLVVVLTLVTVSSQALRAVRSDPVVLLRHE